MATRNALNNASANGFTVTNAGISASGVSFDSGTNVLSTFVDNTNFTPTLAFGGGSTGITYSTQTGRYSRIGNMVFLVIAITLTNKGSSTGDATVEGLPVTIYSSANQQVIPVYNLQNTTYSTRQAGLLNTASTSLSLFEQVSGGAATTLTDADFANGSAFRISAIYFV